MLACNEAGLSCKIAASSDTSPVGYAPAPAQVHSSDQSQSMSPSPFSAAGGEDIDLGLSDIITVVPVYPSVTQGLIITILAVTSGSELSSRSQLMLSSPLSATDDEDTDLGLCKHNNNYTDTVVSVYCMSLSYVRTWLLQSLQIPVVLNLVLGLS